MRDIIISLVVGAICGGAFALVRVPIPAPPVLSGVIGIFGVYAGYRLVQMVLASL